MRTDRLKEALNLRGLSQQDLADRTGISLRQIARYLSGENDPTSEQIVKIARAVEMSADWLVGLIDKPSGHFSGGEQSPLENRLIWALRNGFITEALEAFTAISKESDQSHVASDKPAING